MKLDLDLVPTLPPLWPDRQALQFSWDSESGTVSGRDVDRVLSLVKLHKGDVAPHRMQPENWPINDPLHDPVEMAALLGYYWVLPPELEQFYPIIEDDTPEDAVN